MEKINVEATLKSSTKYDIDNNLHDIFKEVLILSIATNDRITIKLDELISEPGTIKTGIVVYVEVFPESCIYDLVEKAKLKLELTRLKKTLEKEQPSQ